MQVCVFAYVSSLYEIKNRNLKGLNGWHPEIELNRTGSASLGPWRSFCKQPKISHFLLLLKMKYKISSVGGAENLSVALGTH